MLNAANENVLVAIDACRFERVVATVGNIARFTKPELQRYEVEPLLDNLRRERYIERHIAVTAVYFELTESGQDYMQALVARGGANAAQ